MDEIKYRWIKGDRFGTYEIYKDEKQDGENIYINFHSGRRIDKKVISEFLEITTDYEDNNYDELTHSTKNDKKVNTIKNDSGFTIKKLIADQLSKDKNTTNITISINIPILKKEYFEFLQDSNEDVLNDLINIIDEKYIDKNFLKKIVYDKINIYYNTNQNINNKPVDYITLDTVTI